MKRPEPPSPLKRGGAEDAAEASAAELLARAGSPREADDLEQERVWRRVAKELPGKPRSMVRFVPAFGLALGLLVVGAYALWQARSGVEAPARFELTAGNVLAAASTGNWVNAEAGGALAVPSRVRTDATSRAVLSLPRAAMVVSPGTDVGLESLGEASFLRLSAGEVVASVEPRQAGQHFVVQTTRYTVTVKGTVFSVKERGPDDVEVSVSRGLVEVSGPGGAWDVPAGHSWSSKAPSALGPDTLVARDRSLLEPAGAAGQRSNIRVDGPEGTVVSEGGVEIGPSPVSWNAPVGHYHFVGSIGAGTAEGDAATRAGVGATVHLVPSASLEAKGSSDAIAAVEEPELEPEPSPAEPTRHVIRRHPVREPVKAPEKQEPASVPAPAPEPVTVVEPPAPATPEIPEQPRPEPEKVAMLGPTERPVSPIHNVPEVIAEDPYETAVKFEHEHRFKEAAELLEQVANAHRERSELALAELGFVAQKNLKDPLRALDALLRYEKDYPKGAVIAEVELSVIELQLARSNKTQALYQMRRFLAEHPGNERAPEIHLLEGNVLREQGNCEGAIAQYAQATSPALQDDALYFTAWCQQQLGHGAEAEGSMRRYQNEFPQGRHAAQVEAALQGR